MSSTPLLACLSTRSTSRVVVGTYQVGLLKSHNSPPGNEHFTRVQICSRVYHSTQKLTTSPVRVQGNNELRIEVITVTITVPTRITRYVLGVCTLFSVFVLRNSTDGLWWRVGGTSSVIIYFATTGFVIFLPTLYSRTFDGRRTA